MRKILMIVTFCLPAMAMLQAQSKKSKVQYHTFLGVDVNGSSKYTYGMYVNGVYKGYAAEKAGVRTGDSLIAINGDVIHSFIELVKTLDKYKAGDQVELTIVRNSNMTKVNAVLNDYPEFLKYMVDGDKELSNGSKKASLGVQIEPDWQLYGGRITHVWEASAASDAGLQKGDIILKIDEYSFSTPEQLIYIVSRFSPGSTADFEIIRNGEKILKQVKFREEENEKSKSKL